MLKTLGTSYCRLAFGKLRVKSTEPTDASCDVIGRGLRTAGESTTHGRSRLSNDTPQLEERRLGNKMFCLRDYDAYGFDIDHTLAKYKLVELFKLSYEGCVDFLIQERGYPQTLKDDLASHKDFFCKGLYLDADRGNLLKLSRDGKILRAAHGTTFLSKSEMEAIYGEDLKWEHFEDAQNYVRATCANFKYRFFENYFDIPSLVTCAHIVDITDEAEGHKDKYDFWRDLYAAFVNNYRFQGFAESTGNYFPFVKKDPAKYLHKCSEGVKQWLRDLKQKNKAVFLITSSHIDYATQTLNTVIGDDWMSYFDICITNARKPLFFTQSNPFLELDGHKEGEPVQVLEANKCYSQGNYKVLMEFLKKQTSNPEPKVVYFGDSMCSDSFPAKSAAKWDTVLVLEEMEAEGYHPTEKDLDQQDHPSNKHRKVDLGIDLEEDVYLLSKLWGSFFYHPEEDKKQDHLMNTFWGCLISQYSNIAIPSVEYIAGMSIDHKFPAFSNSAGCTRGFSPAKPKVLLP
ncbi:hypothetical protein ScPMuIL_012367 [Solemya velum]